MSPKAATVTKTAGTAVAPAPNTPAPGKPVMPAHPPATSTKPGDGQVLAVPPDAGDELFDSMSTSGKYLPYLQMYGSKSEAVGAGKIPMAHYGLVTGKDKITDLGAQIDVIAVAWRPKAMDTSGEDIINTHDHASAEFKRIQEQSEVSDSGCMFGPEFLVWIPSVKKWAGLFMSSKTARREAPAIRERIGKPSTLDTEFIKTKKYAWHGIVCKPCSTPFDLPTDEAKDEQIERFLNPPVEEVDEKAPETPARDR
jgi:hypothetical protein